MFKHVIKPEPSEGSSSGSERDEVANGAADGEDAEFAGFDSEDDLQDGEMGEEVAAAVAEEEAAFWEDKDEELPENLPSLQEALVEPVYEAKVDAKGRKTLICVFCPDKMLREGTMKDVHLQSSSHKRRAARYAEYIEKHSETSQETADPRRVSSFLDIQLRLRKSGGAGFVVNPTQKRKRRRNRKKTDEEKAEAAARAIANGAKDTSDGVSMVAGMTAMNAKQKRKQKQNENKAKGISVDGEDSDVEVDAPATKKPPQPKPANKAGKSARKDGQGGPKANGTSKPASKKTKTDSSKQGKKPQTARA